MARMSRDERLAQAEECVASGMTVRDWCAANGVPEATSAEKELFGTDRMMEALNAEPDAAPQEVLKNVRASVDAFVKDAEQFDDLTMLCLEYKGGAKP